MIYLNGTINLVKRMVQVLHSEELEELWTGVYERERLVAWRRYLAEL